VRSPYAPYDVLAKRHTPSFDRITRDLVDRRLHAPPERRFFDASEYAMLEALCARLLPQPTRRPSIPIAPFIDAAIFEGKGEGFRRPGQPRLPDAWRQGLAAIDRYARVQHSRAFVDLGPANQDELLTAIQESKADGDEEGGGRPSHFFTHLLLKSAAGVYYSHPDAWSEIGFGGPASPRGYVRIGLDDRDPWEAPFAPPLDETA
jgi:hypothetical protein